MFEPMTRDMAMLTLGFLAFIAVLAIACIVFSMRVELKGILSMIYEAIANNVTEIDSIQLTISIMQRELSGVQASLKERNTHIEMLAGQIVELQRHVD